jgi:opacity protein-like surface antigen
MSAQTKEAAASEPLSFEAGVKTNVFFDRLLGSDENELTANPYLLTAKMGFGQLALRAGIGGAYKKEKRREEGFANSTTETDQHLDIRLGIEKRMALGKKWLGSVGVDGIGFFSETKSVEDSGFDVITTSENGKGFGFGLAGGLQYDLTRHLSLYTEGFLQLAFGKTTSGQYFKNFPVTDDTEEIKETREARIGLPSSIYLVFRF